MSIMQNALAARQAGFDEVGKFRQTLGQNMAGNALAAGDSRGAANALFSTGQLDAGEIVQQRQEGRQQRQQANQFAMEDRQAGQDKQAQEMRAMAMVQAGKALQGIPMDQRLEVLNNRVAPMFQRIGIPTDVFQGMSPEDLSDESLAMFVDQVQRELEIVKGSDGSFSAVDPRTGQIVNQYQAPRYQALGQGQSLVEIGGGQGGGAPAAGGQGFDGFYNNYLAGVEGGFAADDGNGAPVNFGINQGANPDVNVRGLSQEQAKELLRQRYWEPSGADQLPPALGAIHGDTAINMGLGAAKTLLEQSGGDPQRYLELREQRYRTIAERDPSKARYLNTWLRRNQQLAQFAGSQPQQGGAPSPIVPGNIDLNARPQVRNPDGSTSTISSMSFGAENGEVLIPTISDDGRRLSEQEAIALYRQTGRHLGIFRTPQEATAFAKNLSSGQGVRYGTDAARAPSQPQPRQVRVIAQGAPDPMRQLQIQNLEGQIGDRQQKAESAVTQRQTALQLQSEKARAVISTVDEALGLVNMGSTALIGSQARKIPGTTAYDLDAAITTIKANLGFQELQAMREASPTGGALGQVAVQELVALQATVANLDTAQSQRQVRANLQKIRGHYDRWLKAVTAAGGQAPPPAPGGQRPPLADIFR